MYRLWSHGQWSHQPCLWQIKASLCFHCFLWRSFHFGLSYARDHLKIFSFSIWLENCTCKITRFFSYFHFYLHLFWIYVLKDKITFFIFVIIYRWQSIGYLFMAENKVSGINLPAGLSITNCTVKMWFGLSR